MFEVVLANCPKTQHKCDEYNLATIHCMDIAHVLVTKSNSCFSIGR
jgi:hypothetical protein